MSKFLCTDDAKLLELTIESLLLLYGVPYVIYIQGIHPMYICKRFSCEVASVISRWTCAEHKCRQGVNFGENVADGTARHGEKRELFKTGRTRHELASNNTSAQERKEGTARQLARERWDKW